MNSKYENWSKDELVSEIEKIQKRKDFGLVWVKKPEDVVERCREELPVLEEVQDRHIDNGKENNHLLIQGDNYHALSTLNYTHKEEIDVIYIDPPYNTGATDWTYNNNYVDLDDPYRHSKWISFMAHRLQIAKNVLAPDGIICCTIDDYEMPRLWLLMEEIFGEHNHLGTVTIRNNPGGRKSKRKVAQQHEYALFFSKKQETKVAKIQKDPEEKSHNYKKDDTGWYEPRNLRKSGADSRATEDSNRYFPIYFDPETGRLSTEEELEVEILPTDTSGDKRIWRRAESEIDELYEEGEVYHKKTSYGHQVYFKFRGGLDGETPKSIWTDSKFSAAEHGTQTLDEILGEREEFPFPKSPHAVKRCIEVCSNKTDATILDFFAGSGTTAQAVLDLNEQDGGSRKFILCTNNENGIATDICYPRVEKVINGYETGEEDFEGYGGNLKYFKTNFVPAEETDRNKRHLTTKATEMLRVKEDTHEKVLENEHYKIFKNSDHYTGILYEPLRMDEFKDAVRKYAGDFSIYIFSLGDDDFSEEFEDMEERVKVSSIPEVILRSYRRIFG